MKLYAESSAVLSWLLGERRGPEVRALLGSAEQIVTSELTIVECERTLLRVAHDGARSRDEARRLLGTLLGAAVAWSLVELRKEVLERARQPLPEEPLRTLDAIHVASAIACRQSVLDLAVLSLDARIRRSTMALGFEVVPEATGQSETR